MRFERLKIICSDYSFLKQLFQLEYLLSTDHALMAVKTKHTGYNAFPSLMMFSHPLNISCPVTGLSQATGTFSTAPNS